MIRVRLASKIFIFSLSLISLFLGSCASQVKESFPPQKSNSSLVEEAFYQKNFRFISDYSTTRYLFYLNQEIHQALTKLEISKCWKPSTIQIIDKRQPLALTTSKAQILISSGLIAKLSSANELFFVLAHENAHISSCDLKKDTTTPHQNLDQELAADLMASKLLVATARPISAAYSTINRLYQWQADQLINVTHLNQNHPSQVSRLKNLNQIPKNISYQSPKAVEDFLNFQQLVINLSQF